MRRKPISIDEYRTIRGGLTNQREYPGAVNILTGRHRDFGRVVLMKSIFGHGVIADRLNVIDPVMADA